MHANPPTSAPPLRGRRTQLRLISEADYEYLYFLSLDPEIGHRWRHRGETPSPEAFVRMLWHNVLVQFLITDKEGAPIGHAFAYDANQRDGHASIAILVDGGHRGQGWTLESMTLFVNYVFAVWNFRKLYFDSIDFNYQSFASGAGRYFREEGCLRDHTFYDGKYVDKYILALYRDDWDHLAPSGLRMALGKDGAQ